MSQRLLLAPVLLLAALSGAAFAGAAADPAPADALPPSAAATPGTDNSSVGTTARIPNVAYPQAPVATPAAEGADRARPPTEAEKVEQRVR